MFIDIVTPCSKLLELSLNEFIYNLQLISKSRSYKIRCPKYIQIRSPLLDLLLQKYDHFVDLSNLDKLSFLINYEFKLLARYLYDAWNIRKSNIYV